MALLVATITADETGEGLPHMPTAWLHEGTLVITQTAGDATKSAIFSMDTPESDDSDDSDDSE